MTNRFRGEAPLTVGGDVLTIVFDINALILAEEATGMDLDPMLKAIDRRRSSMTLLRSMLWAGLQEKHPCNLLRAGEIVGTAGVAETHTAVTLALSRAFPDVSKKNGGDDGENPPMAAGGTG